MAVVGNRAKVDGVNSSMEKHIEDLKMEYGIKYERLMNIHQEIQKAYVESQTNVQVHNEAYKEYLSELKKDVFDKEMHIYNLKQEITDLKTKNADLETKVAASESSITNYDESKSGLSVMTNVRKSIVESPVVLSSIPKMDVSSPLCLPTTPRCISRLRRVSMMNETIEKATPSDQGEREAFYKRVIMDQKDLLDFYATLTGYMAWKEPLPQEMNDDENVLEYFKLKPQNIALKDMEIQFLVDYEQDDIEYHPLGIPDIEEGALEKFSPFLREKLYLSSQMAPQLLKALLDVIES